MKKLTPRQERFVREYLVDLNATQAAIRAGYSPKGAEVRGSELLRNRKVADAVERGQAKRAQRLDITADRVLAELARVAFFDIAGIFDEDGNIKPVHEMPEDARRVLAGIEAEELFEGRGKDREAVGSLRKVKVADKLRALELLGKHLGILTEKSEHKLSASADLAGLMTLAFRGG